MKAKALITYSALIEKIGPIIEEAGFWVSEITVDMHPRILDKSGENLHHMCIKVQPAQFRTRPEEASQKSSPEPGKKPAGGGIAQELLGLTLGELVSRYGDLPGIERYAQVLRDISTVAEKEQAMALGRKPQESPEARPSISPFPPDNQQACQA